MVWVLRGICIAAVAVVASVATWQYLESRAERPQAQAVPVAPAVNAAPANEPGGDGSPVVPGGFPTGLPGGLSDAADGFSDADDVASGLKNPLTRSLGQMIEGNREFLEQAGAGDLGNSLMAADEILWEAKQRNFEAIRQANRQQRLPGRSPNLVLITVEGLGCSSASELEDLATAMPALYRISERGMTAQMPARGLAAEQFALVTGIRPTPGNLRVNEAPFSQSLWQSGYATAAIGDVSWWGSASAASDWDAWLGFQQADEVRAFPDFVWSNGRKIVLPANQDGKRGLAAHQLFVHEALQYLQRHRAGRPFALCVSLTADHNLIAAANHGPEEVRRRVRGEMDDAINQIEMQINRLNLAGNTLVMIVGLSERSAASNASASPAGDAGVVPQSNLLVVRGPGRLPAGVHLEQQVPQEDVLPTILDAVFSQRRPRQLQGVSRWSQWQRAKMEPAQAAALP